MQAQPLPEPPAPVEVVAVRLVGIKQGPAKPVRVTADGKGLGLTITASSIAEFLLARTTGAEFVRLNGKWQRSGVRP